MKSMKLAKTQATLKFAGVTAAVFALLVGATTSPQVQARAKPHPSGPSQRNLEADYISPAFYALPPGVRPVNTLGYSRLHVPHSYAWRRHNGKLELLQFGTRIQHVVVIYMENRTPDDLFGGYFGLQYPPAPTGTTFGTALDLANPAAAPTLVPNGLEAPFDPGHGYQHAFVPEAQSGSYPTPICNGTCSASDTPHSYVPLTSTGPPPTSEVQNYVSLIVNWAYASHVMQSNEGPSFPAHQYAIAGQSGGILNWSPPPSPLPSPFGMVENPQTVGAPGDDDPSDPDPDVPEGGGSCFSGINGSDKYVHTVDMSKIFPQAHAPETPAPCNEYNTIFDEIQASMGAPYDSDWQYIADSKVTIWSGPMGVGHLADAYKNNPDPTKSGEPFAVDPDAQNLLQNVMAVGTPTPRPFAALTYIAPCFKQSDHPNFAGSSNGPQWLSYVVNAIGESSYWPSTTIIVVWDDWGGFYDHVQPAHAPSPAPTYTPLFPYHPWPNAYNNVLDPYEWGYRVPMIVISPWVKSHGYISTKVRSQAAILNFIESVYGLSSLGTDDMANGTDDLTDMLNLTGALPGATYSPLPTPSFTPGPLGACP